MPSPDDAALQLDLPDQSTAPPETASLSDDEALMMSVLAAVVTMALRSKRRQAELEAAICRAGINVSRAQALEALDALCRKGWVDSVVPLQDGGVLLSVTGLGLEVAGRHRLA